MSVASISSIAYLIDGRGLIPDFLQLILFVFHLDIIAPTQKTVDALARLEMPAGVYIDIKMKNK